MFRVVQDFLDEARVAGDEDALCDAFEKAIGEIGFNHFAAGSALGFTDRRSGTVFLRRYPEDWSSYYMEREFWKVDPTLRLMREYGEPFMWTDPGVAARFSASERDFMVEAAGAGVRGGVTIPIRGAFMFPGQVNIYSSESEAASHALAKLHNLSVYFYDFARRMAPVGEGNAGPPTMALNKAERECLLWASLGRTEWEIADLAGMTELNVRMCVESAQRKLGVPSRLQAVVRAVLTDQIIP